MRNVQNWVQSYLALTEEHEAPEEVHFWTAMAVLSAALRRKVFMRRGSAYRLYPNIYVLIVGESGKIRKSVATEIGLRLLKDAVPSIHIMGGRITPEAMVKYMNRVMPGAENGVQARVESDVLIHADELATLFGYDKSSASRMAILLTEIYASKDEYSHRTKSDEPVIVKNLYPTLLAATDPRNLKVLPEEAVAGLLGRTIFVPVFKRKKKVAWPELADSTSKEWIDLQVDLVRINALSGEMMVTKEAKKLFADWYDKFADIETNDPRIDAFHERAHDTALKISMLLSVAQNNDMVVTDKHVAAGIAIIEKQMPQFARIMQWAGTSVYQQNRARFIDIIKRHGGVAPRRTVMRALAFSAEEMAMLEISLLQEGTITAAGTKGQQIYTLTPEAIV